VTAPAGADLGLRGDARQVTREVMITPQTRWINVESGETVRFSAPPGGEAVVWHFDTSSWATGRLGDIAPNLAQGRDITIYVAMSLIFRRHSGWRCHWQNESLNKNKYLRFFDVVAPTPRVYAGRSITITDSHPSPSR
jgi:hypothetical protein